MDLIKPISFTIKLHIYPYVVLFIIGKTDAFVHKLLLSWGVPEKEMKKDKDYIMSDNHAGYATIYKSAPIAMIRLSEYPTTDYMKGILSHEIDHVVTGIMKNIGMYRTNASEEAYTHLTAYITEQAYAKLRGAHK